jgi:Threonine dehydrogenase and related Zn-dependent dehydrogenases
MDINASQIESIVRSVLSNMGNVTTAAPSGMARVAMLTAAKHFEVKEFPIPEIGDDEILVKVEGCGVCGTDVHEWKGDPFGYIPLVLGHEGTGEIIALGKNVTHDTQGHPVKIGDKIVTSVICCNHCWNCLNHPEAQNLCENQGIHGLIPDSPDHHLAGWFATHLHIKKGSTFFVVNELSLDQRMLLEPAAVTTHALEQGKKTGRLKFNSKVLVQGCGPIGLMMIATLRTMGVNYIIALDGNEKRLEFARRLGADAVINFKELTTLEQRVEAVKAMTDGVGADFVYQCTGNPNAASDAYKYVRRGGGPCEMGFFVNNGECTINPHFDICNKEIMLVGSWDYGADEYPNTIAFMKRAKALGLPLEELITHRYPLDQMNEAMETNISQKGIKICYIAK